jgi:hypothetical protein
MNAEPMKDELKKGGSQKKESEAGRKEQVRFGDESRNVSENKRDASI